MLLVSTGGRSATVGYLGPSKADFSETHQIAYLAYKRPILTPKIFLSRYSRSTTPACLGSPQSDFSKFHQIAYLSPISPIFVQKKFQAFFRSARHHQE